MILLIDNYDSFVFNLARYLRRLGAEVLVRRNDAIGSDEIRRLEPAAIVLSPGPCSPTEAGCSLDVVRSLHGQFPILGVCLGHQVIAEAFGGRITRANRPVHGQASLVQHYQTGIFSEVPTPLRVGRYHSLVVEQASVPPELEVTATAETGMVMAVQHREFPVVGVQFHPESILTDHGFTMLANFCRAANIRTNTPVPSSEHELPPIMQTRPLPDRPVTF